MKKIIITLTLLLAGNTVSALDVQNAHIISKCQGFIYTMFNEYGLPLPGMGAFPVHGDFKLEKFNQEKPEFTITTRPMEIKKQPLYQQMKSDRYIITPKNHLKFEADILEDGNYTIKISEINPAYQTIQHMNSSLIDALKIETPLVHTFHFSNNCDFITYDIGKQAGADQKGFYVSANSQCEFDEPHKTESELTAHILYPNSNNPTFLRRGSASDYMFLRHPNYYRELCAVAKSFGKTH